ncbi:MAG TPA: hypothetical protein VK544_09555 [Gemmatimonadaceae bacterium]|nr:hypothetical protein [Gemmatimonadaceae bacterium]
MLAPRTLRILFALLIGYALLVAPAYWGKSIGIYAMLVPLISIYVFNKLGIPGLLDHKGACGWGICNPTPFGYAFVVVFWIAVAWFVAWGLARLTSRSRAKAS